MGILKNRSFVCIIIAAILCQVARNYLFVYMFLAKINHSELVVNSILCVVLARGIIMWPVLRRIGMFMPMGYI